MSESFRIVLLGTGTDVGKTYVGAQLAQAWRADVGPVLALKPVESGVPRRTAADASSDILRLTPGTDAARLAAAATQGYAPLYAFADPVSPHLAAAREGREIDLNELKSWVKAKESLFQKENLALQLREAANKGSALSLIESAGGVFSPLSRQHTNLDLAQALEPAFWILVAPDSVGVLHDLGATLRAMRIRPPDLVLLSCSRRPDATTGSNASEIHRVVYPALDRAAPRYDQVPTLKLDSDGKSLARLLLRLLRSTQG